MGSWVDDFNTFQNQAENSQFRLPKGPKTRKEKLEAELQVLQWHKLANEAAIKTALMQNKNIKTMASPPQTGKMNADDARYIRQVIDEEHTKPLEVSRDFMIDMEKRDNESNERLAYQVEKHIQTLKNLRDRLEKKQDTVNRSEEYRSWQKEFAPKKHAVMLGKTLNEVSSLHQSDIQGSGTREMTDEDILDDEINQYQKVCRDYAMRDAAHSELSNVLDSLNKLAELEKRITHLEEDSQQDLQRMATQPPAFQRSSVEFQKKRKVMATDSHTQNKYSNNGPVGIVYAVKPKPKLTNNTRGQYSSSYQRNGQSQSGNDNGNGNGGFFLTEYESEIQQQHQNQHQEDNNNRSMRAPESEMNDAELRAAAKRERQRQLELASMGQKNLRSRVQMKKTRQKEQALGAKRHEEAMKELVKRRQDLQKPVKREGPPPGRAMKGASSGLKSKNRHLQEFEQLKSGFAKRKEGYGKASSAAPSKPSLPVTSKSAPATVNRRAVRNNNGNGNSTSTAGRVISVGMTNPTNTNPGRARGGGGSGAGSAGGSALPAMTRRTDKPTRPRPAANMNGTMNGNNNNNNNNLQGLSLGGVAWGEGNGNLNSHNNNHNNNSRSNSNNNNNSNHNTNQPIAVAGMGGLRTLREMKR